MYQRIGHAAYKADLNNTIEICRLLGNPEKFLNKRCIHIAGTNGKVTKATAGERGTTSTSAYLFRISEEAALKTKFDANPAT